MNTPIYFSETELPLNQNPWLEKNTSDFLYHLGFDKNGVGLTGTFEGKTLMEIFGDVTHVCMGGSPERAQRFAQTLNARKNEKKLKSPYNSEDLYESFGVPAYLLWKIATRNISEMQVGNQIMNGKEILLQVR